eukprot:3929713-Ditylum_brightwellii.AAC.1
MGIILDPNRKETFSVNTDADFSGNWFKKTAMHDVSTAKSRTGQGTAKTNHTPDIYCKIFEENSGALELA